MAALGCTSLGFIGLGAMGGGMVSNLAEKLPVETKIYVYDIVDALVEAKLSKHPNKIFKAKSAKEVAELSNIVVTMVPEGSHVRSVYMDPTNGLCATDLSGKLLVDCSTIDTATCLTVKAHIAAHLPLAHFYDAPVSGGAVGAANGVLAFFLGCSKDDPNLPRLETLLSLMGKKIIPCGGPSLGLATKLAHNYLGAIIFIATSEAMNMGMRSGLDARILSNAFAAGAGQSTIAEKFNPVPGVCPDAPASNGYKPGFKIELHKKDLGLAVEMARRVGADLALGETALETYTRACNDPRCKDLDSSAIYRFLGGVEDWPGR